MAAYCFRHFTLGSGQPFSVRNFEEKVWAGIEPSPPFPAFQKSNRSPPSPFRRVGITWVALFICGYPMLCLSPTPALTPYARERYYLGSVIYLFYWAWCRVPIISIYASVTSSLLVLLNISLSLLWKTYKQPSISKLSARIRSSALAVCGTIPPPQPAGSPQCASS